MTASRAPSTGSSIAGRFTIEMAVGTLPHGPVYRALDTHLQRRVTLRTFPATTGWRPEDRARFEADIRKATPLDHAKLAGIRDYGADPARELGFLVYEPLYGMTLGMFLARRHSSPPVTALQILHEVAEGVGAAHWAGLVHGEIHPGTIFMAYGEVDRQVRIQLLSPGLPLPPVSGAEPPAAARYAAPELLRGESEPTPASDVYSLGVVAYELLVGLPAGWDESVTGAVARESIDMPPANQIRPEIPGDIADAIAGALHVDPAERFNDANTFGIVLAHALDASTIGPRMTAAFEGMPEFLRAGLPEADEPVEPATADAAPSPAPTSAPATTTGPAPAPAGRRTGDPAPSGAARPAWKRPAVLAAAIAAVLTVAGTAWTLGADPAPAGADAAAAAADAAQPDPTELAMAGAEATDARSSGNAGEGPTPSGEGAAAATAAGGAGAATSRGPGSREGAATAPSPAGADRAAGDDAGDDDAGDAESPPPVLIEPSDLEAPAPLDIQTPAAGAPGFEEDMALEPLPLPATRSEPLGAPSDDPDPNRVYGLAMLDERPVLENPVRLQRKLQRVASADGVSVGRVLLQFRIRPDGTVDTATVVVVRSTHDRLNARAREVMAMAEFAPGTLSGVPVNVQGQLELVLSPEE